MAAAVSRLGELLSVGDAASTLGSLLSLVGALLAKNLDAGASAPASSVAFGEAKALVDNSATRISALPDMFAKPFIIFAIDRILRFPERIQFELT
jgi:hypothetical protein